MKLAQNSQTQKNISCMMALNLHKAQTQKKIDLVVEVRSVSIQQVVMSRQGHKGNFMGLARYCFLIPVLDIGMLILCKASNYKLMIIHFIYIYIYVYMLDFKDMFAQKTSSLQTFTLTTNCLSPRWNLKDSLPDFKNHCLKPEK